MLRAYFRHMPNNALLGVGGSRMAPDPQCFVCQHGEISTVFVCVSACSGRRPMIYLTPEDTATVVQHTSSSFGISTAGIRQAASSAPSAAAAAAALSQPGTAVVGGGVRGMYVGMSGVREQAGMRWSSGGESRANDEEDRALL